MEHKIYSIEENKKWFSRVFKRQGKQYSLRVDTKRKYVVESWCWEYRWDTEVIENSNDLGQLKIRLRNLKVVNNQQ